MKANRSISMTLLVLMLVSSWSVPADAGLLDRLCRIGRARTTACRPVQKQGLLGRLFKPSPRPRCTDFQDPPGGGFNFYCPQKIFEVWDGPSNRVFCVYKMQICGSTDFFLTYMSCNTQSGNCAENNCAGRLEWENIQPMKVFIDQLQPSRLTDFDGIDHLGYRAFFGSITNDIKSPSVQNIAAGYKIEEEKVAVMYNNSLRTFQLFMVTGPDSKKTGFGVEIVGDKNSAISDKFKIYAYPWLGPLQFQEEPVITLPGVPATKRRLYMVYPKSDF